MKRFDLLVKETRRLINEQMLVEGETEPPKKSFSLYISFEGKIQ